MYRLRITPQALRKIAFLAVAVPGVCALVADLVTRFVPACHVNPYGLGQCVVGGVNLAAPLLLVGLGGLYFALASLFLIALPLHVTSWLLEARIRRKDSTDGQAERPLSRSDL
jgi:hypothetical protein